MSQKEKEVKQSPFDLINHINKKTKTEDLSGFSAYMTNRYFSSDNVLIEVAEIMNHMGAGLLSDKAVFDFYFQAIPKNSGYRAFPKNVKTPAQIKEVQQDFQCSEEGARYLMGLIDEINPKKSKKPKGKK